MNLHLEEYQGAVRKKNEPENPLKDLHQRMEEEKQDLIRHLKGRQLSSALLLFDISILCRTMDSSIKFNTFRSGWFIVVLPAKQGRHIGIMTKVDQS